MRSGYMWGKSSAQRACWKCCENGSPENGNGSSYRSDHYMSSRSNGSTGVLGDGLLHKSGSVVAIEAETASHRVGENQRQSTPDDNADGCIAILVDFIN